MKTKEEIQKKLDELQQELPKKEKAYSNMHQIDMLSGEGNEARKVITELKSAIFILNWVLST